MIAQRNLTIIRSLMFLVNLVIILFMSAIIYNTTELICRNNLARDFLEKVKYVPTVPWKVQLFSVTLLLLLFLSVIAREKLVAKKPEKTIVLYLYCISDIIICIAIMYCLNMSYKGILLLVIANITMYIDSNKSRSICILTIILIYILLDYDILSVKMKIFAVNDYIQYYSAAERLYIFGLRNIMTSLNEVLFIAFMMVIIHRQIDENQKIKGLYARLYQSSEELKIMNIQLQEYAKKSEEMAKTKERNRLAREIHDTIGHTLTGIATGLEACIELMEINVEKTKVQIVKIAELARHGLVEVRRSMSELRPDALERFSLLPAIQKLADDITECTKTKVTIRLEGESPKLSADEEEIIYRITQEGITNAVRHGNARHICILLEFRKGGLTMQIADDGVGCNEINFGFGLKHIRERVAMLKGDVEFVTNQDTGFTIQVKLPIRGRLER